MCRSLLLKKYSNRIIMISLYIYPEIYRYGTKDFFFESFIITLDEESERKPVFTNGDEFYFMLKGSIELLLGKELITLLGYALDSCTSYI